MKEAIIAWLLENILTDELIEDLKKQFISFLREKAMETDNVLDDKLVDIVESVLY